MCSSVPRAPRVPGLDELSLDEKIGQMFVYGARGGYMAESSPSYRWLVHQVRDNKLGGLIWFQSNVYETAHLNRMLQNEARVPLLISADLETGIGMRFIDTTMWPSAMALAATGDPTLAEQEGRVVAREARAIGVNHILAPVADVNVDPDNPVINTRSFGEEPAAVGRFVAAFVHGVQSEHALACAKHFPGHGDTHVDSHRSLPALGGSRDRLDRVELVPFRAAIEAGVASIMIAHLAVPSLDPAPVPVRTTWPAGENPYNTRPDEIPQNGTMPATTSKAIVTDLLRRDLKFDGLVVTDAMEMGGITEHFDAGEAAIRAIEAGQDQILMSPNIDEAMAAVKAAVAGGRLTEARIDASVRRILLAKERAANPIPSVDAVFRTVDSNEHRELAATIARRALTLVREEPGTLPLKGDARVTIIQISELVEPAMPLPDFEREVTKRLKTKPQVLLVDARTRPEDVAKIIDAAKKDDLVILALAVRTRSGSGQIAVPEAARRVVAELPPNVRKIAVAFGSPYLLREIPSAGSYLCAYGIQPVMQVAAASALFGETPVTGKLPVTIPGLYPRGHGLTK
jgi:beta-glucosidase-like glycosyl hydrolase